ncbi:hypothetical protein [Ruthenibacterium lactatiformans]|uniref:hypothetical protein n=1 Tax=Ruthenibacterium lactatiformans TaxID=1550024 RepID=UPI0026724E25|nr:hypothetical protein [Ruthenibacterium lactatiformans]
MIYDSADIELLRFAAAAKNIPPDLQYRLSSRVWDREHIHTLCAQKLLAENRNHLSISLTLKGATLLNHLGWPVTLDAKQPARNKLERRLQSAWTAALFYRAGFGIFNNKASDLAMPETYLPANALRRDTTVATTRVFAGVRYMGIAHSAERMLLAHYVDGGHMYITSEMRMFNTMAVALSNACTPAVIYCGLCYDDLARLLTGASAFMPAKRRGSDAVTYRVGAERTQYPLFLVETTNTGVFQIALITRVRDYRQRVAKYALQDDFLPAPDDAPALDAMMRLTPFLTCVDMDVTRIRQAVRYAKARGFHTIAAVALPCQLNALALWFADLYPIELYAIEQSELECLFPEVIIRDIPISPYTAGEEERYVVAE